MSHNRSEIKKTFVGYCIGFALSLVCTLIAFWVVMTHLDGAGGAFPTWVIVLLISALAITQFIVQLVYFLHLGTESKPRWKLLVFWFMIIIVLIIVVGSIWIMDNLNYNMMRDPEASQQYIDKSQGF